MGEGEGWAGGGGDVDQCTGEPTNPTTVPASQGQQHSDADGRGVMYAEDGECRGCWD